MKYRKKLIEVSVPLEAINAESAREKSIRHGHPSTLHLWWARRPLAACRAVLFASLVDDPSEWPEEFPTKEAQDKERQRLHDIIGKFENESSTSVRGLVSWDDIKVARVIEEAQREIAKSIARGNKHPAPTTPEDVRKYLEAEAPKIYDPFCGGGSIPLEAQRLGLEAHGSDLNPVAVLITKALIEIPPKFAGLSPVSNRPPNPPILGGTSQSPPELGDLGGVSSLANAGRAGKEKKKKAGSDNLSLPLSGQYFGAQGLAADVRYYGLWMRDEAQKRIGHLYPQVELATGGEATVIAWLWARTVKCPNPACGCQMPLVRSFELSTKKGKEAWVEPIIDNSLTPPEIKFEVKTGIGKPPKPPKNGRGANFICLACEQPVNDKYIKAEGIAGRMDAQLMAIVAEGNKGRLYLSPTADHEVIAKSAKPTWYPNTPISEDRRSMFTPLYGLNNFGDLFTARQLVALTTFSDLVGEARAKIVADAVAAGMVDDKLPLNDGGTGVTAYADAVATYLAFAVDKAANYWSTICAWHSGRDIIMSTFGRQAIPMVWDYAETNPLSNSTGNFAVGIDWIATVVDNSPCNAKGVVKQLDATSSNLYGNSIVVSTDPPYYDNIGYADLSDFFYVWLRRSIGSVYPDLFKTLVVPKAEELVATPYRHEGSKQKAKDFFEDGLYKTFQRMREMAHEGYPLTVYYAFKQQENETSTDNVTTASSGWETMLEGLIRAGFTITGTLPMRTELVGNLKKNISALASSIALICRPCPVDATSITRRQFLKELQQELPLAIANLQQGNLAPVDMAQASIGPGMGVFSRYKAVLESDGARMQVRTALQLINRTLDEFLNEQEGEFDGDTRWALTWFEQHQYELGDYGEAETLSRAKSTSIKGLETAGIVAAKSGKVKLLTRQELPDKWIPAEDDPSAGSGHRRIPVWEATQHLIRTLEQQGEVGAAALLMELGERGENARDLAYRLYSICEAKGWTSEAIAYNSLVSSWSEISRLALEVKPPETIQKELILN
jgi:putative DNA methylase